MENLDKNTEELAKKYAPYLLTRYKANVKHLKASKNFIDMLSRISRKRC
jgi:Na+/phosphate symporter